MNIQDLSENMKVGSVADGNYNETRMDGTTRLIGTATSWRDMVGDLFGKKLASLSGKVDYDWLNNNIIFQSGGSITNSSDRVGSNIQINHEFKVGPAITFKPHIHWFQEVTDGVANTPFVLTMRWRLQNNGLEKNTDWTVVTLTAGTSNDIFTFTGTGTFNQLSRFPDMDVSCNVSDTIQYQVARTDTEGGDMNVYFMDLHGMVDSFGSDEEIAKA